MIKITHNAGFFSCCSVKLHCITQFINKNKKQPENVDSSQQFSWYKQNKNDITYHYFEHYNNIKMCPNITNTINYRHNYQFSNYSKLDYDNLTPLIKKYFTPSIDINNIVNDIENKYNLTYNNICVLFYRGNDKNKETKKCSYDEYLQYANKIKLDNPNILFMIQSDETEFIEFITKNFPSNSFYFKDEIRHMKKCSSTVDKVFKSTNYEFSKKYLAITIIMSKCKYIVCGSGNCDIWIMLYRGHNNNVIQNLNGKWL